MKKLFISAVTCALHLACHAQTANEWLFQQKTRIKYLVQQAAALLVYRLTAEKGWAIAGAGIDTIVRIDSGEFNLHQRYYQSLRTISPVVRNSPLIGKIQAMQALITEQLLESIERWNISGVLNADMQASIDKLQPLLSTAVLANLDMLTDVLTEGRFDMTDGERIQVIREIYENAQRVGRIVLTFSQTTYRLVKSMHAESSDLDRLKKLLYE